MTAVNDAPALDAGATPVVTGIAEDVTNAANTGTTVATLVANGSITDVDVGTAPEAIFVSAVNNSNGTWEYRIGAGAWTAITLGANQGLLLDATALDELVAAFVVVATEAFEEVVVATYALEEVEVLEVVAATAAAL